jgi:RNA polymerase sigma-70 factor, ECF subfamily
MPNSAVVSDEVLVRELASGRQDSFGRLYRRYASLILNMAAQSLDRSAAEEIVQDVFMTVWRRAALFTPERGTFRAWVLQMAHFRILNELRRRRRRPQLQPDPDGALLAGLADEAPKPEDAVLRQSMFPIVRSACRELPGPQRQAVDRVFFRNLSHRQAAAELGIPLGTIKTRIRTAVRSLRGKLAAEIESIVA